MILTFFFIYIFKKRLLTSFGVKMHIVCVTYELIVVTL